MSDALGVNYNVEDGGANVDVMFSLGALSKSGRFPSKQQQAGFATCTLRGSRWKRMGCGQDGVVQVRMWSRVVYDDTMIG